MAGFLRSTYERASRTFFATPLSRPPLRVLVVDDDASVRNFVMRVMVRGGYDAVTAASGAEGLAIASERSFDVLLTDLMMPGMDGHELACLLRAREPDLRVLYLTGFADRLFAEHLVLWDNEAFLDKPCTGAGLLEAVSLLASGHIDAEVRVPEPVQPDAGAPRS